MGLHELIFIHICLNFLNYILGKYTSQSDQNIQMMISNSQFNCDTDYVNIYNGPSTTHPRVGRICGAAMNNRSISITSKDVFIEFHTDAYDRSLSFNIDIIPSDGVCGGTLDSPQFVFSSPKNGTKYPANIDCEWILRAQTGFHIGLYFPERFMIESSTNCNKDYLQVFDKVDDKWVSLARFCGREVPNFVNSTGREMKVVFHTDNDGDGDGFSAAWTENCGGVFRVKDQAQIITSPRYPEKYPKSIVCNYSLVAEETKSVAVKFLDFELEETARSCNYDNITVYKASIFNFVSPMEEVGTYCWQNSVSTFRYQQRMDIVFRTDSWIERRGFKFEYSTDKCGGNIVAPTRISSVHDENNEGYLPMATCVWNITAPVGNKITIRFEQFDLEHMSGCYLDYVEIYEGHRTVDSSRKARLCGNLTGHAPTVSIQSNKALVKFGTDATVNEKGFTALVLFSKNCDQHIRLDDGSDTLYYLDKMSGQYEGSLNCEYFISAPQGKVIQVKFDQMHLAPCETTAKNDSCTCDYLTIRDGSGPFAESFGMKIDVYRND